MSDDDEIKNKCHSDHCANVINVYKTINHELSSKVTELKVKQTEWLRQNNDLNRQLMVERQKSQNLTNILMECLSNISGAVLTTKKKLFVDEIQSPALNSTSPTSIRGNCIPIRASQSIGKVQPIVKVPGGHIQSLSVSLSRLAPDDSIDLINRELEPASHNVDVTTSPTTSGRGMRNDRSRSSRFVHNSQLAMSPADSSLTSFEFDDTMPEEMVAPLSENLPTSVESPPISDEPLQIDDIPGYSRTQMRRSSENMVANLQTIIEEAASQLSSMSGTIAGNCTVAANKENNTLVGNYNVDMSLSSAPCSTPYNNRRPTNFQMIRSLDVKVVLSPLKVEEIKKYKRKLEDSDENDGDDDNDDGDDSDSEWLGWESEAATTSRKKTEPVKRRSTGRPKRKAAPKELVEVNLRKKLRRPKKSS